MTPKQILIELKRISDIAKYPNIPGHAIPQAKYTDKTANGLTKMIIEFIKLSGGQAERINTMGRPALVQKEAQTYRQLLKVEALRSRLK